ncbi:hydantoinase B/oxoprolinase family protein [Myxococcota bacterium]|nr:hydantoinase B/oxoprolinase family protein [Myxococcota bacterium]
MNDTSHQSIDDTITREIVKSSLAVAVEEASIVVVRSAYSAFIQEGADACAAILDARSQLVAQSDATSLMHGASLRASLPGLLEDFTADNMAEGDVYVTNDPYRGGIHANDLLVYRPIFASSEVAYFAGTLIHVADLGGAYPAGLASLATDVFSEGLVLPPVRLYERGEPVEPMLKLLAANSRTPETVLGDVRALVAGVNVIALRVGELIERHGATEIARYAAEAMDYAEVRMRESLQEIPEGRYEGHFRVDGDGLSLERDYDVRAQVEIADGSARVDFTGTSEQSPGAINASQSQILSGTLYAVRCFTDPTIPMNEGNFRTVQAHFPEGSLVNPTPPAACGGRVVSVTAGVEAIVQALSSARPDRAVAQSAIIHVYALSGSQNDGAPWLCLNYDFGGLGARSGSDGPDATGAFFLGGRSVIPQIEALESRFPLCFRSAALIPDSGGPGRWRGGRGTECAIELLDDALLTVRGDRIRRPPAGVSGGHPGLSGGFWIERTNGEREDLHPKQTKMSLGAGDVFVMRTSGGGGLGPPHEREPELVLADVRSGRVSLDAARSVYLVEIDASKSTIHQSATRRLREGLASGRDH